MVYFDCTAILSSIMSGELFSLKTFTVCFGQRTNKKHSFSMVSTKKFSTLFSYTEKKDFQKGVRHHLRQLEFVSVKE